MKTLKSLEKYTKLILLLIDVISIAISYFLTQIFLNESYEIINEFTKNQLINSILISIIVYQIFLNLFEVYKNITMYEGAKEYFSYALACMVSSNVVSIIGIIFNLDILSANENLLAGIFTSIILVSYRVIIRFIMTNKITIKPEEERKRLLIIGAGDAGTDVIKNIKANLMSKYNIVGIIDDNQQKKDLKISGVKILGGRDEIIKICKERKIDIIFFAISNISAKDRKEIFILIRR